MILSLFSMIPRPPTQTIGETLIDLGALASFTFLVWSGNLATPQSLWIFAAMLGAIVLFYFLLLLAHGIYTLMTGRPFMTGDDTFWWEKYQDPKKPGVKK